MEFVFIFAIIFSKVSLVNLFEVVQVVRALGIDTFMNDEVLPVLFGDEGIAAVWTAQLDGRETAFVRGEAGITDFAQELSFGAIIPVEKEPGSVAAWTGTGIRDVTLGSTSDRTNLFTITFFVVRDEFFVSPVLSEIRDQWEFINFELLILWGMGIIESPLPKWNVSADKVDQPAVLLVKVLNYRE